MRTAWGLLKSKNTRMEGCWKPEHQMYLRESTRDKEQAEGDTRSAGIHVSTTIGLFLRQVVLQRGIPFEMKLPDRHPLDMER